MDHVLYGAVIGDISGSRFEWKPNKNKDGYPLFSPKCSFTDDTVMTMAVANALMRAEREHAAFRDVLIHEMQSFGRKYPHAGYGGHFMDWIFSEKPQAYGSWGNGSAMRVSACGFAARTMEEALQLARESAEVTHNHPEGIRGAQATAAAVFLAKQGAAREEIRDQTQKMGYSLDLTLDEIRPSYRFDVSCQGSVPQSIECFLESDSYEDTVRNAISLGGDSDTMSAIAGGIAWAYYANLESGFSAQVQPFIESAERVIPEEFRYIAEEFDGFCHQRGAIA